SLDSTTISLCLSLFPWAKFRRTKGAVKLHLLLDHDGYMPTYAYISNGKKHDVTIARKVSLSPGSIITMDRAYNDYRLFALWTESGVYFVTRLKSNADYRVVQEFDVPRNRKILSDQLIRFSGAVSRYGYPADTHRLGVCRRRCILRPEIRGGSCSVRKDRCRVHPPVYKRHGSYQGPGRGPWF
ncbi:MAG: transposase, partial [Desulfobacteraceae bacterium]|nr:transposase [Desulfobacteraceae bacterium]